MGRPKKQKQEKLSTSTPIIKLSISDKYYIEQQKRSKSAEQISQDIDKPLKLIVDYFETMYKQNQIDRYIEIVESNEKASQHIITKSGTTILTQTAAEIADAHKALSSTSSKNKSDRIHRMK